MDEYDFQYYWMNEGILFIHHARLAHPAIYFSFAWFGVFENYMSSLSAFK